MSDNPSWKGAPLAMLDRSTDLYTLAPVNYGALLRGRYNTATCWVMVVLAAAHHVLGT